MIFNLKNMIGKKTELAFLIIFFSIPLYFFFNHIFHDYRLINEYKYFDEKTILQNRMVDNFEYINKNFLFDGTNEKYNKFTSNDIYFYDSDKKGITFNFVPDNKKFLILPHWGAVAYNTLLNQYNTFGKIKYSQDVNATYNESLLYFKNYVTKENGQMGSSKYNGFDNFIYLPFFTASSKELLSEKYQFILANIFEQNIQLFDRYYIHENSFMLTPINEMKLGKDKKGIFSQYGWGSIQLISVISNLYGGDNLNNYEKAKKTLDIVYYVVLLLFSLVFFKNIHIRLLFVLLMGIALFGNKYYFFYYVPDSTNFKHLLDVLIILLLTRAKNIWLLGMAGSLSLLSVYLNKEFGIFIFLSFTGAVFSKICLDYIRYRVFNKKEIFLLIISVIIFLIFIKTYPFMPNPSVKYFFDGFYSFNFQKTSIYYLIFINILVMWGCLVGYYQKLKASNYLYSYIFTIFYIELFFSYIVWHGIGKDLLFYSYLILLPYLLILSISEFKFKVYLTNSLLIVFTFVYIILLRNFVYDKSLHDRIFETHQVYKWNYSKAGGIEATYSFEPFQDSINLIQKYTKNNEIYMISKYDNILAYLSDKYTGLPFFELRSTIVTQDEYDLIKNIFLEKPNLIFVDNDIERDFDEEIRKHSFFDIYNDSLEKDNLVVRIPKLKILQDLFNDVKSNYTLVEKGSLISVYKRK